MRWVNLLTLPEMAELVLTEPHFQILRFKLEMVVVEVMEIRHFRMYTLYELSPQQILDKTRLNTHYSAPRSPGLATYSFMLSHGCKHKSFVRNSGQNWLSW